MAELLIPLSLLAVVFALVAFFYASVGLGGGSAYTAFGAGRCEARTMQKILGGILCVAMM